MNSLLSDSENGTNAKYKKEWVTKKKNGLYFSVRWLKPNLAWDYSKA